MQSRMKHPVMIFPEAMTALQALGASVEKGGVPPRTLGLVHLRASQINGCSVCVDMHPRIARKSGETDERLFALAAWRDTPYFTDAERAALALTEAVTRLSDRADPVPDEIWDDAARHYAEPALAALVIAIATVNVWNRLNAATRQVVGSVPWNP
jgi:AhpD family alkylhydroperoxidase